MNFSRILIFLICIFMPLQAVAFDMGIENDLQKDLQQSKVILERAETKIKSLQPVDAGIKSLINNLENIKASHLLLKERFRERDTAVNALGSKAVQRQMKMLEGYNNALEEYINLVESLPAEDNPQPVINKLKILLEKIIYKKKYPILGSLPYKNLNYPAKEPDSSISIKPAYKGGNKEVGPDDLKSAPEAPMSEEIATLARSLNWNPVLIYEHVKNNIETQWYWGCMKGAEETLRQGSGNDCDQATLLIALLRATGFPSRYVRGVIELEADKLKNLTGIDDELNIAAFLQKAGIPFVPVIKGGKIGAFEIEHIWIESEIPYSNYRGAIIDEHGKTWLGLDTSIKVTGYEYNDAADIFEQSAFSFQLSALRDDYLSAIQTQTPLEYIRNYLNSELETLNSGLTYDEILMTRDLIPEVMNILPASMQYIQKTITGEYTEIPDELMHKVRFTATDANNSELLNVELRTFKLSNQKIVISYEPESVEDQEIINSYGGLDNTPSYLVRLRPLLIVNGERIVVAEEGLPMGADYKLTIELISPNGTEKIENSHITGNLSVIGIVAQKTVESSQDTVDSEKTADDLLYEEAINYIERWNQAEDELASLLHLSIARPVPTIAVIGGVIDVTYLLDMPHGFQWKGVYVDASIRAISVQQSALSVGAYGDTPLQLQRQKTFMQLSALHGSILENRIFEDDFQVESISTAKLFTLNLELGTQNLSIDQSNIETVLPTLPFGDNIKEDIANAVNQGLVVTIPDTETTYEDWRGLGYIKENPVTGEAGYMLSGMIAGAMTVIAPDGWVDQALMDLLSKPSRGENNDDPMSAERIIKLPETDRQSGTVGEPIGEPLAVLVIDREGKPVARAEVTFRVFMGGGDINGQQTFTVTTGSSGIAKAPLTLGKYTADNPVFLKINQDDEYFTRAGLNLVTASVSNSSGEIPINQAFEAYGKPDMADRIVKLLPENEVTALVNNPAGSLSAMVADKHQNPISNADITFKALPAESRNPSAPLPGGYRNIQFYNQEECINPYPLYGECGTTETMQLKTYSFGAVVGTILGNTVNTKYRVEVSAAGVSPVEFILYSNGYRDAGDYMPPGLYMRYLNIVNDKGEPVNAAKAGEELKPPLSAEIFTLYDEYEMEGPYSCEINGSPTNCWRIKASGIVNIQPITNGTITYTPTEGGGEIVSTKNLNNGKYEAAFKTGSEPAINKIEAYGEATITVPEVQVDEFTYKARTEDYETAVLPLREITLKAGQEVLFLREQPLISSSYKIIYTVYGVDVELVIDPAITLLSEEGYTLRDTTFIYNILPPEYTALIADIDLFEIDENNNESWVGYLVGDNMQGLGAAVATAGSVFDIYKKYEAEVVLNRGSGVEVKGERVPFKLFKESLLAGEDAGVERVYHLSRFDTFLPETIGSEYTDSYQAFAFSIQSSSTVALKIYDIGLNEKETIVPETALTQGDYNFVVDYETIVGAGFSAALSPKYYMKLEIKADDGSSVQEVYYPGNMSERTDGKMLGQTMVHDVLIQNGSLNLSRQDIAFKGRGPKFAFTRSYNNLSSATGFKPLGEGWTHSLDMKLRPISSAQNGSGSVPDWVNNLKGAFYTDDQVPTEPLQWTVVSVNGTMFKKYNGVWYAERGRHGTLEYSGSFFIFTSKDGTRYTYDYPINKPAQVKTIEDGNGNIMTFNYDGLGRLETIVDAVAREYTFKYINLPGIFGIEGSRLIKVSGPDAVEVSYAFNSLGYLQSAGRGSRIETYEYKNEPAIAGSEYNLVNTTDSNNRTYTYEYYGADEVDPNLGTFIKVLKSQDVIKKVQYPDNNAALFQYDVQTENKRIVTDLRGNDTTYTLNFYGNPTKIEEPEGRVTLMTWSIDEDKDDNVMTSKTDGRGNTTYYEYDTKGNITLETDPYDNTITTAWNLQYSLPESHTDRNNITRTWQYDANGNLEKFTDGENKETKYTYYSTGERQTMTNPRGNTTNYTYDQWGNPDTISEPEGSITDIDHDIRGRRIAVTDPNGNKTEYTYDNLDYPDKIIHPAITAYSLPTGSTNIQDYDYDAVGNLLKETNRNGLILNYTYTVRDQVETVTRNIRGTKTFSYDENGNLLTETDWKGVETSHTYDDLNQRKTTTNRLSDTMVMNYDLSGNLKEVKDYEGNITTYDYDNLNRLTDTWQPALEGETAGNVHNTYYNEADSKTNLKTITDQEGNTTTYEYNGRYLRTKQSNALLDEYIWNYDDNGNLIKEKDEEVNSIDYEYDKQNRLAVIVQTGNIRTKYQYDLNGNQTHVIDARNKDTEIQYDEWNRPYKVIDPANYSTVTKYNGEGDEVKVTDGNGNPRTWKRDLRGLVLTAVDAEGKPTDYTYDLNGNFESITDARDMVSSITYDAEDREMTVTEASGTDDARTREVLSRDKMGNPLQVKDYNGNITATGYNALYLPKRVCDPAPFNAQCRENTYYKTGKVKTVKNRRGYTTSYEYDDLNREIKVSDAKTQTIETTYDKVGNVKTVKDKRGIITENFYDDLYRLIHTERAGLRLVTNEYDDVGNITAVIDANNNRTEHTYNNRNLLDTATHPDTTTESRTYDGVGNLMTHTNEESKVTTYTYDKENRQTSVEFAGELTQKVYDENGNLIEVIKPEGNCRTMGYDLLNRLITVIDDPDGLNLATTYEYDASGNVTHQIDVRGNDVEFTYDNLNRKTQHIQHKASGNLVTQFTLYDAEDNLKTMIDPMERTFTYDYDELDRQTDANYPDVASPFNKITNIHTEYDANNNVTVVTETKTAPDNSTVTDTTVNNYDNFDRLDDSTQRGMTIDYGYDDNGNRTLVSTPAGTTTYTFDSRNRLKTAVVDRLITTYVYYSDGKKNTVTYPNGTYVKYTYHPSNRIDTVANKLTSDGSVFSSYIYTYDKNGNRKTQVELQEGVTETTTYNYDRIDRMTDFTVTDGVNTTVNEYTFEGYNRKTETVTENSTVVKSRTYNYDETDWLISIADNSQLSAISYSYDNNGNTILKSDSSLIDQDVTFTYDSRNQLVESKRGPPGNEVVLGQYDYNSNGLRVRHRLSERGDIDYYYDDNAVIEEHNAGDDSLLAHYRYADRLISLDTGASLQYYHHDALGSTVNLTDDSGATQVSYKLDPWGHIKSQTGTSVNRQIFTGQEHDENTGLIYFGARYYDPDTARFITQDSYLGEQNTPPSLHRYLYAYSNPLVYVDLLGYESEKAQNDTNIDNTSLRRRFFSWLRGEDVDESAKNLNRTFTAEDNTGSSESKEVSSPEDSINETIERLRGGPFSRNNLQEYWETTEPHVEDAVEKFDTAVEFGTGSNIEELKETIQNLNAKDIAKVGGMFLIGKIKKVGSVFRSLKRKKPSKRTLKALKRGLPSKVYHYTDDATASLIEKSQLGLPGRTTYMTPKGDLSPIQAQIELVLPHKNTGQALFEINTRAIDISKASSMRRVTGNVFNRAGGGTEILYEGTIPLESIKRIR